MSLSDKNAAIKEIEQLKKELAEMKGAVADLTLKNLCLEKLIELGKREYDIDLKKTPLPNSRRIARKSNYPNLLKNREITRFGEAIVTDVTYLHLPNGRFCYASIISNVRTRLIPGWNVSPTLMIDGSMKALSMALRNYKIPAGAIHHFDHGVHYTSHEYTNYLKSRGIKVSMTGNAKCYDNVRIHAALDYRTPREVFESQQFAA